MPEIARQRHAAEGPSVKTEVSVIIPAINEGPNLELLLPQLKEVLSEITNTWEIFIVTREADDHTTRAAAASGAVVLTQIEPGYGGALLRGFVAARGDYILTMDADLSHPPDVVRNLWAARRDADVTVASRYVRGGSAEMPAFRYVLSRVLNWFFGKGLSVPVGDLSSGFRIYRREIIPSVNVRARDFDFLQEMLVRAAVEGWRIAEIPFVYKPRIHGSSHARIFKFGLAYIRTFSKLWKARNSAQSADYDDRAFTSRIPLQRYWQQRRYRYVTELIAAAGRVLDAGCGSSRIIGALPSGSVAMDIQARKLRYDRKFAKDMVQGSVLSLPFLDRSFPVVVCSQVIEHVEKSPKVLDELVRVLEPGGKLVLGTPDYSRVPWRITEWLYKLLVPGGYADEHISHYSRKELTDEMHRRGLEPESIKYILGGELIMSFRKTMDRTAHSN